MRMSQEMRLDFPRRTSETRTKRRVVPAQGGVPGLKDRSRLLADEAPPESKGSHLGYYTHYG